MGGHGVAQTFFPANQPLIGEPAQDYGKPFVVGKTENQRRDEERAPMKSSHRHGLKVGPNDGAINERAIKNFFQRRHDKRGANEPDSNHEPGERCAFAKLLVRIPRRPGGAEVRIKIIQPDPKREDADADGDGFPTDFPAHFPDLRPDSPEHPCAHQRFSEVEPIARGFAEFSLQRGQDEEDGERHHANGGGRVGELF